MVPVYLSQWQILVQQLLQCMGMSSWAPQLKSVPVIGVADAVVKHNKKSRWCLQRRGLSAAACSGEGV